jgi:hypothetical protein
LSPEDRLKISTKAFADAAIAKEARRYESLDDHKTSINKWQQIFGTDFPEYG